MAQSTEKALHKKKHNLNVPTFSFNNMSSFRFDLKFLELWILPGLDLNVLVFGSTKEEF